MAKKFFFGFLFLVFSFLSVAKQSPSVKNLTEDWKIYKEGRFQSYPIGQKVQSIYFEIRPTEHQDYLVINSKIAFSLFLNGQLLVSATNNEEVKFNVDSLFKCHKSYLFSVYSSYSITDGSISTQLVTPKFSIAETDLQKRPQPSLDFSVIAALSLLISFAFLLKTNPVLMIEYLDPIKTFFVKERQGVLTLNRITAASNIFFYILTSFFISFLILSWLAGSLQMPSLDISHDTVGQALLKWILGALMVFGLLAIKFFLLAIFSSAFRLKGGFYIHFYNFMRILILISVLFALLFLAAHVLHTPQSSYSQFVYYLTAVMLLSWLVVAYLKLLTNSPFTFLHLFFYLCITEIIPLIVFIKLVS
jgi:uncharacterized membrane protein YhdT